jgi:hypothetical protein
MAWLARNTPQKENNQHNCFGAVCPPGLVMPTEHITLNTGEEIMTPGGSCVSRNTLMDDGTYCPTTRFNAFDIIPSPNQWRNCCITKQFDSFGNCCHEGNELHKTTAKGTSKNFNDMTSTSDGELYAHTGDQFSETVSEEQLHLCLNASAQYVAKFPITVVEDATKTPPSTQQQTVYLFCSGEMVKITGTDDPKARDYINNNPEARDYINNNVKCTGHFFVVNAATGMYSAPMEYIWDTDKTPISIASYYYGTDRTACDLRYNLTEKKWDPIAPPSCKIVPPTPLTSISATSQSKDRNLFMGFGHRTCEPGDPSDSCVKRFCRLEDLTDSPLDCIQACNTPGSPPGCIRACDSSEVPTITNNIPSCISP